MVYFKKGYCLVQQPACTPFNYKLANYYNFDILLFHIFFGPVREFFCLSLQLLERGLSNIGQGRVIIFEGSTDHKLLVVNNLMKQAGLYLTVGKILAHSILH